MSVGKSLNLDDLAYAFYSGVKGDWCYEDWKFAILQSSILFIILYELLIVLIRMKGVGHLFDVSSSGFFP